ncbi:unnamed protein product, partial [Scytosiphon promiscuus]
KQATLQRQVGEVRTSSTSQRRTVTYTEPGRGAFSAPVARLSKWPNNIFFASDFIADKAAASRSIRCRATRPSRATAAGCPKVGPGPIERRSRVKIDPQEIHLKKELTTSGSSHGKRVLRRSPRGCADGDVKEDIVGPNLNEGRSMERSASALLLLHSRFFGDVKDEDDIVCCLCRLCREAGWMGQSSKECQTLDALVLKELVVEQQRGKRSTRIAAGRKDRGSDACPRPKNENVTFSFEDLYRMLTTIAHHVYPHGAENGRADTRPGWAMHKLLIEGVLPLAADNQPRQWSPRPEILYGRPALAALSMQRDTLHQLYCTHDKIARADNGLGGLSQTLFLEMLVDLGICPASVSATQAGSVFNDVVRNGLPEANLLPRRRQYQVQGKVARRGTDGGCIDLMDKGRSGRKYFSRQPDDERLDWSLFLEAMAALAVGAVKDGQGPPTKSDRIRAQANHSGSMHRDCNIQERPGAACEDAPGWAERPGFPGRRGSHLPEQADFKFGKGNQTSGRRTALTNEVTAQARGDGTAEPAEGVATAPPCRNIFHDSKRSLELMSTLSGGDSSQQEGVDLRMRSRAKERGAGVFGPTSAARISKPPPPEMKNIVEKGIPTAMTKHLIGGERRGMRSLEGKPERRVAFRGKRMSRRRLEPSVPSSLWNDGFMVEILPIRGGETCARVAPKASKLESRIQHRMLQPSRRDTMPSFEARFVASKDHKFTAALDGSPERVREKTTSSPTAGVGIVVDTDGRHKFRQRCLDPQKSRQIPVRPYTPPKARIDDVGSIVMGASSEATGVDVNIHSAAKGVTWAYFKPPRAHVSSRSNRVEGKEVVSLSPAPCHGGSPSALYSSTLPAAVKRSAVATYSGPEDIILQLAAASTVEADAADADKSLRSSRVSCQAAELCPDWKKEETSEIRAVDHNTGAHHNNDTMVVRKQDDTDDTCYKSRRETDYADRITTLFEATGCSTQMFEILLEPEVVAVYSRYRKELLTLFQRYRIRIVPDDHRPGSEDQDISGYVDNPGVRRIVNDYHDLGRWAEGDSILPLIVRVSRQRGRQRCDKAPLGSASGLSYFGFLEVLTRMAYARIGRQPLHVKLLDLISAIRVRAPSDAKTF